MFSERVTDFWDGRFRAPVNADLAHDRRVMVLERVGNAPSITLSAAVAATLGFDEDGSPSVEQLHARMAAAGLTMNGADFLFYFDDVERAQIRAETAETTVRRLGQSDATAFEDFEAAAPEQDRDDAWVELDHWAVFGSFVDGRLVSAASAYPWENARLADIGVVTLPEYRGRGHARRVVRAISAFALGEDFEPQYRCQLDNAPSVALAKAAGLSLFGTWDVITPN